MYKKNQITGKYLHREIYEMNVGQVPLGYHVHHIDKDPTNNSLQNLIAIPAEFHEALHEIDRRGGGIPKTRAGVTLCLTFYLKGRVNNIKYKPGSGNVPFKEFQMKKNQSKKSFKGNGFNKNRKKHIRSITNSNTVILRKKNEAP